MKTIKKIAITFMISALFVSSFGVCFIKADNPTAPVFTCKNASTGVKITWTEVAGATRYIIYRKIVGGGYTAIKTNATGNSYLDNDPDLVSGQEYYYTMKSVVNGQNSPAAPSQLHLYLARPAITATNIVIDKIILEWNSVGGATRYRVYRKEKVSGTWGNWERVRPDTTLTTLTVEEDCANPATDYCYSVRAYHGSGTDAPSSALSSETTVSATAIHNRITLSPSPNSDVGSTITTAMTDYTGTESWPIRFLIPSGNYQLSSTVKLKSNTAVIFEPGTNISFTKKFRLDGDDSNYGYATKNVSVIGGNFTGSNCLMELYHGENITIDSVIIRNTGNEKHAIQIAGLKDSTIKKCHFYGIQTDDIDDEAYWEAIQLDTLAKSSTETYPIHVDGDENQYITVNQCHFYNHRRGVGSHSYALNNNFHHINITDNTFTGMDLVAIRAYAWTDSLISDNIIQSTSTIQTNKAIQASAINEISTMTHAVYVYEDENIFDDQSTPYNSLPYNLDIISNTINNVSTGITVGGNKRTVSGCPGGQHIFYYRDVDIHSNTIDGNTVVGIDLSNTYAYPDTEIHNYTSNNNQADTPLLPISLGQ